MTTVEAILDAKAETGPVERHLIAVLVPCFNEEKSSAKVIAEFRAALPQVPAYVYDNNSTDNTVAAAMQACAVARREPHQGKGHVVRRMFADAEADVAAALSFTSGLILDTVMRGRRELKLLAYLSHCAPGKRRKL